MEIMAGEYSADMAWKMGRILLKYRPIAPKPVTAGSNSNTAVSELAPTDHGRSKNGRGAKRKGGGGYENGGRRGRGRKRSSAANKKVIGNKSNNNNTTCYNSPVVTLPLMPMTPERKEEPTAKSPAEPNGHVPVPSWPAWMGTATVQPRPVGPVGSCVTVECVTDKWRCGEPPAGLETDTCPVFVSDDCDRVTWTNSAYRRMVVGPGEEMMRVALMTRGLVPARELGVTCFMCSVRVRYTCGGREKVSMAAPCDVWRLTDGRLAWRLDLKAALSLGLGC